jgi:molybdate transport system substrate-binding protein
MSGLAVRALLVFGLILSSIACADEALVAVATNFVFTANELEQAFEQGSPHRVTITSGATGKLYAQVRNGAPYDVLLAADQERPSLLEEEGLAVGGSRFTYADGRLVVWSSREDRIRATVKETLHQPGIRKLAIANPQLAPYGVAAMQVLSGLGVADAMRARLVTGENVGQAFTLVATGNADLGLVALSQVRAAEPGKRGASLEVDPALHAPIHQDAVLLRHGADNPAAQAFLAWLKGPAARRLIADHGYGSFD